MLSGEADVIYGSRFLLAGRRAVHDDGGKQAAHGLTNVLFGSSLTDMETCYKVMRGDVARALTLSADRFDIEPEITARLLLGGHRIVERPVRFDGAVADGRQEDALARRLDGTARAPAERLRRAMSRAFLRAGGAFATLAVSGVIGYYVGVARVSGVAGAG